MNPHVPRVPQCVTLCAQHLRAGGGAARGGGARARRDAALNAAVRGRRTPACHRHYTRLIGTPVIYNLSIFIIIFKRFQQKEILKNAINMYITRIKPSEITILTSLRQ